MWDAPKCNIWSLGKMGIYKDIPENYHFYHSDHLFQYYDNKKETKSLDDKPDSVSFILVIIESEGQYMKVS